MARRAYRRFSKEFKLEAIRLAEESGKPKAQVARELGQDQSDPFYPFPVARLGGPAKGRSLP